MGCECTLMFALFDAFMSHADKCVQMRIVKRM